MAQAEGESKRTENLAKEAQTLDWVDDLSQLYTCSKT